MGSVRNWSFDAVIGVGGIGPEAEANGIAGKVNWLGIGPHKVTVSGKRGPEVTFDHFLDYGTGGPEFREIAPVLAGHMYASNVRSILHLTREEHAEVMGILEAARDAQPSPGRKAAVQGNSDAPRPGKTLRPRRCR